MAYDNKMLDRGEILSNLEILKFDSTRHQSIREAFVELVKDQKYASIMNGVITDSTLADELRNIIDAYGALKKYEELYGKIDLEQLFSNSFDSEKLDEFILHEYVEEDNKISKCQILKKNLENLEYENNANGIDEYHYYYMNDSGVYNLQGICLFPKIPKNIESRFPNVLKIDDFYITLDGKIVVSSSDSIERIMGSSSLDENQAIEFLKLLSKERKIPYLNHQILFVDDGYVCSKDENDCMYYSTYNGRIILSSDEAGYCYLDSKFTVQDDKRHIIGVGKLDRKLNTKYGYYDLDQRCEVGKIKFDKIYPWLGYGAFALTDKFHFVDSNGTIIDFEAPELNVVFSKENHPCFPVTLLSVNDAYLNEHHSLIEFLKKDSDSVHYYMVSSLCHVKDDLYIAKFLNHKRFNAYSDDYKKVTYVYALVRMEKNIPMIVSEFYKSIKPWLLEKEIFVARDIDSGNYLRLSSDGKESSIISGEKINDRPIEDDLYSIDLSIKNSLFLEDKYKDMIALLECNNSIDDETIEKQVIGDYRKNYLSTQVVYPILSNQVEEDAKIWDVRCINIDHFLLIKIDSQDISYILVHPNGDYFAYGDGVSSYGAWLDTYNHILLNLNLNKNEYGYKRKILLDSNGNILIGLSLDISLKNGYYIVKKCDSKVQVFDHNCVPFLLPSDDIDFVRKLYVSKTGMVYKTEEKIAVTNYGCTYVIDDDKDYLIYQDQKNNDILGKIKMITGDDFKL